jgi:lysyl endopeptidase
MSLRPLLFAPLAAALAAALPAAASDDGPRSARGAVHTAPQKQADFTSLVTTEAQVAARSVRLTPPAEGAFVARNGKGSAFKRVEIGFGREIDENLAEGSAKNLGWTVVGDKRVTKLRIASPGAAALRVAIRFPATDEPFELRVAGSQDEAKALGPTRLGGIAGQDIWWTPLTEGEAQVIEIVSSAKIAPPDVSLLRVSHLVSGPSALFKTPSEIGASGSCNIDVACVASPSQALLSAARSVVQMLFTSTSGGSGLCTGTVLNDTLSSGTAWLYSGNHCFDSSNPTGPFNNLTQMTNVAGSLNTFFFFDAVACNSTAVPPGYVQRFGGADYLYNNVAQDVLFLRLRDSLPTNGVYLGWDANTLSSGSAMTVLHHPRGDLKKFSTGTVQGVSLLSSVYGSSGAHLNADTGYNRVVYNQGTTEGGSSGSGILTFSGSEYQLRGGLWGGEALCTNLTGPDYYSRLDVAFPALRRFLAPTTTTPALDATDLWYNPSESGWGLNLTQHASGQVFGVWYTYASTGRPLWLVMPGGAWSANGTVFTGQLYKVAGPSYAGTFNPNLVSVRTVGSMQITFSGNDNATFLYTVDGVTGTKVIQRQPF